MATIIADPLRVGNNKSFQVGKVRKIITELEPAGGCTILQNIISAKAVATATAIAHQ